MTRPCSRNGGTLNCTDPASSVLFDGDIPTLTGLDGDMWASQLLTLRLMNSSTEITFNFTDNIDLVRVEVMMFNCPQWGIGVQNITVYENMTDILSKQTGDVTSCEYLAKTCIMAPFSSQTVSLKFNRLTTSRWVHLAEVSFHNNTSECPPDTFITRAEATATTPAMTTPNTDGSRTAAVPTAGNPTAETTPGTAALPTAGNPTAETASDGSGTAALPTAGNPTAETASDGSGTAALPTAGNPTAETASDGSGTAALPTAGNPTAETASDGSGTAALPTAGNPTAETASDGSGTVALPTAGNPTAETASDGSGTVALPTAGNPTAETTSDGSGTVALPTAGNPTAETTSDGSGTAALPTAGNPTAETTSETVQTTSGFPVTIIIITAIPVILVLILIVAVAVILLCCWRCKQKHRVKEEASHSSGQISTHTHQAINLQEAPEEHDHTSLHMQRNEEEVSGNTSDGPEYSVVATEHPVSEAELIESENPSDHLHDQVDGKRKKEKACTQQQALPFEDEDRLYDETDTKNAFAHPKSATKKKNHRQSNPHLLKQIVTMKITTQHYKRVSSMLRLTRVVRRRTVLKSLLNCQQVRRTGSIKTVNMT